MGTFLDDLKKSVDTGEFNSEAAKKIIEVNKLADEKAKENPFKLVIDRIEKTGFAEAVPEEDRIVLNSEYEKQMEEIKKQDEENKRIADMINVINTQISTLVEIEDMVKLSVQDMLSFVKELEDKFSKEIEAKDPMFTELNQKLEEIKLKYISIINN